MASKARLLIQKWAPNLSLGNWTGCIVIQYWVKRGFTVQYFSIALTVGIMAMRLALWSAKLTALAVAVVAMLKLNALQVHSENYPTHCASV